MSTSAKALGTFIVHFLERNAKKYKWSRKLGCISGAHSRVVTLMQPNFQKYKKKYPAPQKNQLSKSKHHAVIISSMRKMKSQYCVKKKMPFSRF